MQLIATCAFGLEKLVYNEIKKLGLWVIKTEDGRVTFEGDELALVRANLWLRTAGRVHVKMAEFEATDFDDLFEEIVAIEWEKYIGIDDVFPVVASSAKSVLHSESALQSIVKKAIVTRLSKAYDISRFAESTDAVYQVRVHVNKDQFLISIDSSGDSLHKRGYRSKANQAPMKETLAAAMVMLSDWTPERKLVDPFCGSGTILIEAALIAQNKAPGLMRSFAFQKWPWINAEIVEKAYTEARAAIIPQENLRLQGYDLDGSTLKIAEDNALQAGITGIHFECNNVLNLEFHKFKDCTFITNPPYGERLEEQLSVEKLYKKFGEKFKESKGCSLFFITPDEDFPTNFGARADKNRKLFNGPIRCYLYSFLAK